jgi:hypothetical protein
LIADAIEDEECRMKTETRRPVIAATARGSPETIAGDLLLHVDNGHHSHFHLIKFINDPVSAFVDFPQPGIGKLMDRVSPRRHRGDHLDSGDQSINLPTGVEF